MSQSSSRTASSNGRTSATAVCSSRRSCCARIWIGDHWSGIRDGTVPGYAFLPAPTEDERSRFKMKGYPEGTDAAIVLANTCVISPSAVQLPRVASLSGNMVHMLQARLVDFWSARGWKSSKQASEITGKQIVAASETHERFTGPAALYKFHVRDIDGTNEDEFLAASSCGRRRRSLSEAHGACTTTPRPGSSSQARCGLWSLCGSPMPARRRRGVDRAAPYVASTHAAPSTMRTRRPRRTAGSPRSARTAPASTPTRRAPSRRSPGRRRRARSRRRSACPRPGSTIIPMT